MRRCMKASALTDGFGFQRIKKGRVADFSFCSAPLLIRSEGGLGYGFSKRGGALLWGPARLPNPSHRVSKRMRFATHLRRLSRSDQ